VANYLPNDEEKALVRVAGGIIHGDGNIFFTDFRQFSVAAHQLPRLEAQMLVKRELEEFIQMPNTRATRDAITNKIMNDPRLQSALTIIHGTSAFRVQTDPNDPHRLIVGPLGPHP
jgi:uncharacterized protein YbaA (DUF1428 family)